MGSVGVVSAKSYTIFINEPTYAGGAQFKPGEYTVKVDGSQIVLKDNYGHQTELVATLDSTDHKFQQTAVMFSTADGTYKIKSIELGGTNTRVVLQ